MEAEQVADEGLTKRLQDLIVPMPGKIAVLVSTRDEITPQGLFIPVETARSLHEERPTQGVVVAIGDDEILTTDDEDASGAIEIGDHVIFGKYTGTKISYQPDRKVPKETVVIMREADILCILRTPTEADKLKVRA